FPPAINSPLREVGVLKQSVNPADLILPEQRPVPVLGHPTLVIVGITETEVPIPEWLDLDLASPVFVHVATVSEAIDVLRHFDDPMLINERIHIEILRVALSRAHEVRPIQ